MKFLAAYTFSLVALETGMSLSFSDISLNLINFKILQIKVILTNSTNNK